MRLSPHFDAADVSPSGIILFGFYFCLNSSPPSIRVRIQTMGISQSGHCYAFDNRKCSYFIIVIVLANYNRYLRIERRLRVERRGLIGGDSQLVGEGVVPDLLHIVPVGDDAVLDGVLQ